MRQNAADSTILDRLYLSPRLRATLLALAALGVWKAAPYVLPATPLRERVAASRAVWSADHRLLRLTLAPDEQYRLWLPLERFPRDLVDATLLYEDRRFAWHPGVDPIALARAGWATLRGARREGGSTLTMQLARRLHRIPSRTPWGKARQIGRALLLELTHTKRELLEAYLNFAPYGGNIEGAGAASLVYFRKPVERLARPEAFALAVIPQNPSVRARNSQSLQSARAALFAAFAERHPEARADDALFRVPVELRPARELPFLAPHLTDELLERAGPSDAGEIVSTIDLRLQRLVERRLSAFVARRREVGLANAAALLVDGRDMSIKALVGSADFHDARIAGQVNGALAKRSPGSALKPFVYALGLEQGVIHPATMLRDVPTAFAAYSPENFDGRFAGPLPAREALVRSRNIPALEVASKLARPGLHDLLRLAGITGLRDEAHYGLGLALGNAEVTMEELVTLYAALGARGVLRPLRWRADDPLLPLAAAPRILGEEASFLVVDMLKDAPPPPGAEALRSTAVAWKTGTSWGFRDAWTAGLFGPYVLAVWAGNFSGEGNPAFVGIQAAAPLFFEIVDAVLAEEPGLPPLRLAPPAGVKRVEVCALSGGLPTPSCPHRATSWFIPGRSPIAPCSVHRRLAVDEKTGRRVCPPYPGPVREEVYEVWPSDLRRVFAAAGLPRRPVPPAAPGCEEAEGPTGALRITSPRRGLTYTLRPGREQLALQAVADGGASQVYWFLDDRFLGRARAGAPLLVTLQPGTFVVRAVDDLAHADSRELRVERPASASSAAAPEALE